MTTGDIFYAQIDKPKRKKSPVEELDRLPKEEFIRELLRPPKERSWGFKQLRYPVVLTSDEAARLGFNLETDWLLNVKPRPDQEEPAFSFITPDGWEIEPAVVERRPEGVVISPEDTFTYISPEGKRLTREEVAQLQATPPEADLRELFEQVYPGLAGTVGIDTLMQWAVEQPTEFLKDIHRLGRNEQTEALLRALGASDEDLEELFAAIQQPQITEIPPEGLTFVRDIGGVRKLITIKPDFSAEVDGRKIGTYDPLTGDIKPIEIDITEATREAFARTPWKAPPMPWAEAVEGFPGLSDLLNWLAPTKLGAGISVVGAYLEKFVGRPWETAILEANARFYAESNLPGSDRDRWVIQKIDEAREKYGWAAIFAPEVSEAWEHYLKESSDITRISLQVSEWLNPAYIIPIGGTFAKTAAWTAKIPVIGRTARYTAAAINAGERALVFPVAKPIELSLKGLEKAGQKLGEKAVEQILRKAQNLHSLDEIAELSSEKILDGLLVDNWMKTALNVAAKVPIVRSGIRQGLGWRILVKRGSDLVDDIVGRAALLRVHFAKMGVDAKAVKLWELQAISRDPVKLFGFNKRAYSPKMAERLLPEYASEKEIAGTLEHVFTHPEMYNWKGLEKGLEFVAKAHEINSSILNLLRREGIDPKNVTEDWWIHRVVEGKFDPDGELIKLRGRRAKGVKGAGAIGAKKSFELARKAPTMAEGIAWGIQYNRNPMLAISSYIEEAFQKIGDARFMRYVEEHASEYFSTPSERLLQRFPEVVERFELTKQELADAAKFHSLVNRAIRGEKPPEATLKGIEAKFPDLGRKFRQLVEEPLQAEKQLREVLQQTEKAMRQMRQRLEKLEKIDVEAIKAQERAKALEEFRAELRAQIPDDQKIKEVFQMFDYDERLALRNALENQMDDVGRLLGEQQAEFEGITEFLMSDPVASATVHVGKRKVHLDYFLKKGDLPESFTLKEAAALMMKPVEQVQTRVIKKGVRTARVPREVVLDEMAARFGMSEDELIAHLHIIAEQRLAAEDAKILMGMAKERQDAIKRMMKVLDDVNAEPQFVPKEEPLIPEETITREVADRVKLLQDDLARLEKELAAGERPKAVINKQIESVKAELERLQAEAPKAPEAPLVPKAPEGMPEAGLQQDMFGYQKPVYPKGKGEVTQVSMDDYQKLVKAREDAGLPPPEANIKPKIEGIKELEGEPVIEKVKYQAPGTKSSSERLKELKALRAQVKELAEQRKVPYWQAKAQKAFRMEQVRQPDVGEGFIRHPFAGGKIFDQEFIDAFNSFFGYDKGLAVLKATSDVAGILRITKAALDFSFMAIQGLPSWGLAHAYLLVNPVIGAKLMGRWYQAWWLGVRSFFDPDALAGYMAKNSELAMQRVSVGGSARAIDYFAALEARTGIGGLGEKALTKIPLHPYQRAEVAFFGAGEVVRDEFWRILAPKAIANGKEFELARILDRLTGISDSAALGVPLTLRQLEQTFVWFAPNYTRACLTILADIFRGGMTGAEVRKALGGMIAAGATMYSGIQYAIATMEGKSSEEAWQTVREGFGVVEDPITHEISWRPTARFMTIRIGNFYFGFGGFWYGLLRLAGNIMAVINEVGEKERIDLVTIMKNGSINKDNPFIYWWYSRSSPFFGTGFELASGRDFLGYPIETPWDYGRYVLTRFEPIWMEQGLNWMVPGLARDSEIPEGLARQALAPAELFGLRTFPESDWVKFYDKVNELIPNIPENELDPKQLEAWRSGTLGWKQLTSIQQVNLLNRYPELRELYEEAQAANAVRGSDNWKQWQGRIEEERTTYYTRGNNLVASLRAREIDTRELREKWSDAGQNYGKGLEDIEKNPLYEEIYDFFDRKQEKGDKYGFLDDVALEEYRQIMFTDYLDAKGDMDWEARDAAFDAFIEKWGEETYNRIRKMYADKRLLQGMPPLLVRLAEDKDKLSREYWELPYKPIAEMDEEDEAQGNIPAEFFALWKEYRSLETEEQREAFLEQHPELAKDWRAEYRLTHPEDDARLAFWGYGGKLQTLEAYNLVSQWAEEFGVPMEQLGLGLPPRSLIDSYFNYNKVIAETSGNSPEARLYRLEHPRWDAWGQENWGWKPVDDHIEALRISVDFKDQDSEYEAIRFDDASLQREARAKYLEQHPEYAEARRRREAYQMGIPDELVPNYVEYAQLPTWGHWKERYRQQHPELDKQLREKLELQPIQPDKIPAQAYDEIYQKYREQFEQYDALRDEEARQAFLEQNPEFARARRRREAYGYFLPEKFIDDYVEYYSLPKKGMEQELYLAEHPDFAKTMAHILDWQPEDGKRIESLRISVKYKDLDAEYEGYGQRGSEFFIEDKEERDRKRQLLLANNPDYAEARRRREAYDRGIPDQFVENYVEYFSLPEKGYDRERYLKEHQGFYDVIFKELGWTDRIDFDRIPSKKFEETYNNIYSKLPRGALRYQFRGKHPWFDEEGVKLGYWKPYTRERMAISEELAEILEEWEQKLEDITRMLERLK